MPSTKDFLRRVAASIRPGGVFVAHEYFEYGTFRILPRSLELEEFVRIVMESWRHDGGEPDIARQLPAWPRELGFELRELRPIVDVVPTSNLIWNWPRSFVDVGLARFVEIGRLTAGRARAISEAIRARDTDPNTLLVTPAVLEIIAVKK
ncbi:MAG: hypothetical protein ACRD16_04500 [Thermoanaerobaculia bacterium]